MSLPLIIECPPTLRPGCPIMFIGEAPGECEVHRCICKDKHPKEGFVGRAGRVFEKIIYIAGLTRSDVSLSNVVKRAPDGGYDSEHFVTTFYEAVVPEIQTEKVGKRCKKCNRTFKQHTVRTKKHNLTPLLKHCDAFDPIIQVKVKRGNRSVQPTQELQKWYELLAKEIRQVKPNIIVACGGEALKALCGISGITKYCGSLLTSTLVPGVKVVPILHPSYLLRSGQFQEVYILGRIIRDIVVPHSATAVLKRKEWNQVVEPTLEMVLRYLDSLASSIDRRWCLDIETRGGSIACIGIASSKENCNLGEVAMCIPIQTTAGPYWESVEDEQKVWLALEQVFNNNPNLVGHNLAFDLHWLLDYGIEPCGIYMDTMLAFHRLYPELPKGLDFLTMLYTDIPYYKMDSKTWGSVIPNQRLWEYNCKDVITTLRASYRLDGELKEHPKQQKHFFHYDMKLLPIALEMQYLGMDVDVEEISRFQSVILPEWESVRSALKVISDGELVVKEGGVEISNKCIHNYLYKTLGLPPKKKPKTGKITADEEALVELSLHYPQLDVLKLLIKDAHLTKAVTSYLNVELED